jgi:CubicO group peptidase (beta-lactamase class C family)
MIGSMTRRGAGALLGAWALAPAVRAQDTSATADTLALYMRNMETFGFGGQVLAARGGEIVLHEAYGWADRRARRRMRKRTPMGVASVSKQFTAAAILKLAEAGAVALDQPIGAHLPAAPPDKAALTLHQLLGHTAGLAPGDLADDFEADSKADILARAYAAPLLGPPGERWRYANAGYNLAAAIIEAVSGRAYEDFLVEALFEPAGLPDTGFARHVSLRHAEPARAYRGWLDQGAPADWPRQNFRAWGSGSVFSTAGDLYRWQQALERGAILAPASVAALIAPHARPDPEASFAYAYGAFVDRTEHGLFIERSGDWERGYNAAWHRWPEQDLTLIIVANSVAPSNMSMRQAVQAELEQILRGVALEAMPPAAALLSRTQRRLLRGAYAAEGAALRLIDDGAYLWAAAQSQPAVELMLPSLPAERRDAYRTATAKTERLFANVSREAYAEALARPEALDEYWTEWTGFVSAYGAFLGCQTLGSTRQGPSARSLARLRFERGEVILLLLWSQLGAGGLVGTAVFTGAPAPYACVLGATGERNLLGYDTLSGAQFGCVADEGGALTVATPAGEVVLRRR